MGQIRSVYTPRWIQYYTARVGSKPTDSYWLKFRNDLESIFQGVCAYCEEYDKGEVDHFKPKSTFPDLVYSWTNWLFVCHGCNHSKSDSWPPGGYVDPCAISEPDRPEHYFAFDTLNGFIIPNTNLTPPSRQKAEETIKGMGLNNLHHRRVRTKCLKLFAAAMPANPEDLTGHTRELFAHFGSREVQLSSLIRAWLSEHGYPMEDLESE